MAAEQRSPRELFFRRGDDQHSSGDRDCLAHEVQDKSVLVTARQGPGTGHPAQHVAHNRGAGALRELPPGAAGVWRLLTASAWPTKRVDHAERSSSRRGEKLQAAVAEGVKFQRRMLALSSTLVSYRT